MSTDTLVIAATTSQPLATLNGVVPAQSPTATILSAPNDIGVATAVPSRAILGHPIMIYQVPQIVRLTYPASTAFTGYFMDNYPLNRNDFRMVRGAQNEINFYVRDVDRKPVSLGYTETLTINITDPATDMLLMTRTLTTVDSSQGIYLLTVLPNEMDTWPTMPVRWSVAYNRADGSTVILWTDRIYSPYSTCTITRGAVPGPAPTIVVSWSQFTLLPDNNYYSPSLIGSALHGFSGGVQSFYISMTNFSGMVRIDASLAENPVNNNVSTDWFQVDLQTYISNTGYVFLNETGNYLWMRMVLVGYTSGTINQFQYKR